MMMVLVGTNRLKIILQEDIQLADRCPVMDYSSLENWSFSSDFKKFLASYEKFIPLPEPSNLASDELARAIFERIRFLPVKNQDSINNEITPCVDVTNLRRITRFLMKLASNAVIKGKSRITMEDVNIDAA
jgi:hypothetical protein